MISVMSRLLLNLVITFSIISLMPNEFNKDCLREGEFYHKMIPARLAIEVIEVVVIDLIECETVELQRNGRLILNWSACSLPNLNPWHN